GTPSININLDLRGKGFSETFALSKWHLDYSEIDLNRKIDERIEKVLNDDLSGFDEFATNKIKYRKVFDSFIKNTADLIREKAY
ncbi:MAG: hypothetical protein PF570_10535, partial [Candidatus Cloacimonetes bacterium]|nr:hypothetical protein [Candidatus Cloacimonadota bacterium]